MLGLDEVPCIVLAHLTPTQRRACVLADKKLALNAGWDLSNESTAYEAGAVCHSASLTTGLDPTDAQRRQADMVAAYGIPEADIARVLGREQRIH
jgi:ParB-like chromosome segregation protein Spo0J